MFTSSNSVAILAAAGSRKTELVVEEALAVRNGRVLITTYTNENQQHILDRIRDKAGVVPTNIHVLGWFTFLIGQCAKPYQSAFTNKTFFINSLNFKGKRFKYAKKTERQYFLDSNRDLFRDGVSDFVMTLQGLTGGAVLRRLESIYSHILIDEVQDLAGFDLDFLDMLMRSKIKSLFVGDPRQHTYSTNESGRNSQYRGEGLRRWFEERSSLCELQNREISYRCNQLICDFADAIYPALPRTMSGNSEITGHDGIFYVRNDDVTRYIETHGPLTVLRHNKNSNTYGHPAMNFGVAKGRTFDRVLIVPTEPMLNYLTKRDPSELKAPERLYVAVTRAKHSIAFVVPKRFALPANGTAF